jgi:hypothetical protein
MDSNPITSLTAAGDGTFTRSYDYVNPGTHTFGLTAEDDEARETPVVSFTQNIPSQSTVSITDIFLPPTIELSSSTVAPNTSFSIFGMAQPDVDVYVTIDEISDVSITQTNSSGNWSITKNANFGIGTFSIYAYSQNSSALQSENSHTLTLTVSSPPTPTPTAAPTPTPGPQPTPTPTPVPGTTPTPTPSVPPSCARSDLNCDSKVNLIDFSILLFYWGGSGVRADINQDGIVSLPDFSIMLFDWTG